MILWFRHAQGAYRLLLRGYVLVALTTLGGTVAAAQKPRIDASVYGAWPSVGGAAAISNDGKYVWYSIREGESDRRLVVRTVDGHWKREVSGASVAEFSQDSRHVVFMNPPETLNIATLGDWLVESIPRVSGFSLPAESRRAWLAYQLNTPDRKLVLRDLSTSGNEEQSFASVTDYVLSEDGTTLVLQTESGNAGSATYSVSWVSLADGRVTTVWQGTRAGNFVLDRNNSQLAFLVEEPADVGATRSIWYYRRGAEKAVRLTDDHSQGIEENLKLGRISFFSKDGSRLFLNLEEQEGKQPEPAPDVANVYVWSYTDAKLQSVQKEELNGALSFVARGLTAALRIADGQTILISEDSDDNVEVPSPGEGRTDDFVLVEHNPYGGERHWNRTYRPQYVASTKDSTRAWEGRDVSQVASVSPTGKYLVYYEEGDWFAHEIDSHATRNVTRPRGVSTDWSGDIGVVAGWLPDDAAFLVYDQHDIWQVDPGGKHAPLNVTNGYGRRSGIVFEMIADRSRGPFAPDDELILSAFNRATKENGFYRIVLGRPGDPERLSMGPYLYYAPRASEGAANEGGNHFLPIKARDAKKYLVRRMSATESPNFFVTRDFKAFTRLSDVHPERDYNWLSTELMTWTTLDGNSAQGVLYKPEDFDPAGKYPVILYYYNILSNNLNVYRAPNVLFHGCAIDIPTYVSNGYLVFTPDIRFKTGALGQIAVNYVVSGAKHLSTLPWVDGERMGIQGCSWGGFTTNYLVTQTELFAAAVTSSGGSDYISGYGSLTHNGMHRGSGLEVAHDGLGGTLWEMPERYIRESAVLQADKVTTPLLLMHTTIDGAVPFSQAIEMFTALRRLGKKAWLLEYVDGDHGLWGKSEEDFSIRMKQFFDHYLKGAPPPKWMTQGLPARLKGVETGLELDTSGRVPGPGLLREAPEGL